MLKVLIWVEWVELSYPIEQVMGSALSLIAVWQIPGFENTAFRAVHLIVVTAEVETVT